MPTFQNEKEGSVGGDAFEAPKVTRGGEFPADYGVWGSVVSSPSGVRGGAPADHVLVHFGLEKSPFGDKKCAILG